MNDRRAFLVLMNHTFPFVNFIVYGIRVTFLDNQNSTRYRCSPLPSFEFQILAFSCVWLHVIVRLLVTTFGNECNMKISLINVLIKNSFKVAILIFIRDESCYCNTETKIYLLVCMWAESILEECNFKLYKNMNYVNLTKH
uniref:Uncharacterized protein n=1 Tax=Rhizophagus irregularis (strain DAOM 181602 / DAOM 197198 / MUCL 43194) TaxID=747089 RepID=U9TJT2_RHIID